MGELRPSRSRADLRSEPILRSSASETSSTGTRWEEEVGFSGIRIGGKPGTGRDFRSGAENSTSDQGLFDQMTEQVDRGGHYAAWEQPQLFSEELRTGFGSLR